VAIITKSTAEALGGLNEWETIHAPAELHMRGDVGLLRRHPRVAVVGSRRASEAGLKRTADLVKVLVSKGIVVVSGLAEGIDTAAHRAAIEAGGRTIAVIGTPLDECYPAANRLLQDEIAENHLLVSQYASGAPVSRANFPMRNRTMALIADATVIVEASEKSGTRHQGWEALRMYRTLMIMSNVSRDPDLTWPAEMIQYGAIELTRGNLEAVLEDLPTASSIANAS